MRYITEHILDAKKFADLMRKAYGERGHWDSDGPYYSILKVIEYAETLLENLPFKIDDKVQLAQDLEIPKTSGWWCHRHLFIKGATAVVKHVDVYDGKSYVLVTFDKDSDSPEIRGYFMMPSKKFMLCQQENK